MKKYLRHPFLIVCARVVFGGFLTAIGFELGGDFMIRRRSIRLRRSNATAVISRGSYSGSHRNGLQSCSSSPIIASKRSGNSAP
jgi:hypothetical protein